ncbi:MAG: Gfo/Idh/MocA family oxidoreductase [Opitutaceae bacterium]
MNDSPVSDLSRRRFLTQTGLGLAAVSTLSRSIAQGTAANSRLRLGLIGCGGRGAWIAALFAEHGGYEIAAAADYFQDRVNKLAETYHLPPARLFTGLKCAEKMIAQGGLDAVAIISPPYFHPTQAQAAVDAGLHVYLAKPVAVDVPGCLSIRHTGAEARRRGQVFLVDFQTRTNEFFKEAVRRVHAGAIGELVFGSAYYHAGRLVRKADPGTPGALVHNWVFDRALSGDIIVEQNIHTLDVMSWLLRETPPLHCTGTGGRSVRVDVGDAWDHFTLTYEYANHVGVNFSSRQFDAQGEPGGIINQMFGTKGVFNSKYGGLVMLRGGAENYYRGGETGAIYKEGAVANIQAFHQQVTHRDVANATVEPSVTSNLVALLGRTAAYEGRRVTWSELMASRTVLQPDLTGLAE